MYTENEPLIVRKDGHRFMVFVEENGNVSFQIDADEKKYTAKAVVDGKIIFRETHELFIGDNVEFIDGITLDDLDFTELKTEQNLAIKSHSEKKDELRELTLTDKNKKELLNMVDKWQKRTKTVRRGKERERYTTHTFTIGREHFRFTERLRDGEQLINPDYKILTELDKAGGVAVDMGEAIVWKFYYEESDTDTKEKIGKWKVVRLLTFNEQICYEIIRRYGTFHD